MSENSRDQILAAAADLLRCGDTVSLESAARAAGLSKPGLMYHFRTMEALMVALVDHVVDDWESQLASLLDRKPAEATPRERIAAYLRWALSGEVDESHLAMLSDLRLRRRLVERWKRRMHDWLVIPAELEPAERTRLQAVRLMADGAWFADATGIYAPTALARDQLRLLAEQLLED